jgi:ABC-2 type transport system permease protein
MSALSLAAIPRPMPLTAAPARPGLGRLTRVELRKMVDTRAGFWLLASAIALTVVVVAIRAIIGDAQDHTFRSVLNIGLQPTAVLLPIAGLLLVTSEWSQRTGLITFTLTPMRSRILAAKLVAGVVLVLAMLALVLAVVTAAVLIADPGVGGTWADSGTMIGQAAVYLVTGVIGGVAFGAALLASAPAIVAYFALPTAWAALVSLPFLDGLAPWVDTIRSIGPLSEEVLDGAQWAQAGTTLVVWMVVPLLIGIYRVTRREISA